MVDINKALAIRKKTDPRTKLFVYFYELLDVYNYKKAEVLPPTYGASIDHTIKLEKEPDGKEKEVPQGSLYNMSRDELLVLRKTLTELVET